MGNTGQMDNPASRDAGAMDARLEGMIGALWMEILGVGSVRRDDDFFELGGDSLGAVRMLAALEDRLLTPVSFVDFLDGPTVAALAAVVRRSGPDPDAEPQNDGAGADPVAGRSVASYAQERLWFLQQLEGATNAYNMPIGARLRGRIDDGALERGLLEIVRRHAALRSTFASDNGQAVAVEAREGSVVLERSDLRGHPDPEAEAAALVDALAGTRLDLERGPLMRALLVRTAEDEHILELVFHHIICDGWSQVVVLRELGVLYDAIARGEALELPAPRIQYPEYARRQRNALRGDALDAGVALWLARLEGAPAALELPTDRPRPKLPSYRGATHRMRLSPATAAGVRSFARAARSTPFATLLAAYYVLLHRYSGQDDIVVGATTSGRASPELSDGVGLFASTVAVRCDLSGQPGLGELVGRVHDVVMWAVAHEQTPFEQIVARRGHERDLSRHPVFQVFCAHVPQAPLGLDGAEPYDARPATSRFDLTLFVEEEPDGVLELAWEYSTDLFDAATIERFARHYVRLLEAALAAPELPIDLLPMLDEAEQAQARQAGAGPKAAAGPGGEAGVGAGGYPVACMHERFEQHAAANPDAVALRFEQQTLTYGDLNRRANRLAHRLRALGAGPETMVALFLEPSLDLITALLAVLKAGAAYVPLDPEYPGERVGFVLQDTAAPLLVTQEALLGRLPDSAARIVCLDRDADALEGLSDANPPPAATPENLAYVIYTSGSTGRPKGVLVEHRQIARLFTATDAWYGFGGADTWVLLHSYAFDFSVWEIWGALAYGGRLVISPLWTTRSPQALSALIAGAGVTVMNATPSLFMVLQEELLGCAARLALRLVVLGGEALAPAGLRPWFEHFGDDSPRLVNMYGITETTVHVTYRPLRAVDCDREASPIGVPIPDLSLHLLDARRSPVPPGVAGELFVGGAGVARGYLNRPELTAERFVESPLGAGRLYRTGDIARRLPDGELDFRGRIDDQVKIRGFRIELGEIQAAMLEVPGVADAAAIAVAAGPGDTRLAAYVVPDGGSHGDIAQRIRADLLAHLEHKLPAYMIPAAIVLLDRLPLTRNGKTDRRALPEPIWESRAETGFLSPRTPTEELVAEIWGSVLGLEEVGRADNFFNLGGHSLLAARVATQVRERCTVDLSVRALFEAPTLSAFAAHVDRQRGASSPPDTPDTPKVSEAAPAGGSGDDSPLSFQQQQLLFFDELEPGNVIYNAALALRVSGRLDRDALHAALEAVLKRHEALRTALVRDEVSARQVITPQWAAELALVDLSALGAEPRDAELQRQIAEHARRPFDLSRDLMLRATLFALAPSEHVLLFQAHHVAFDAWAVEVLYRDLGECYNAAREEREPQLPQLALQYRDFARWQRERLRGDRLHRELDFWRAQLAGAPTVLQLPTDRRRPPMQTFAGASVRLTLDGELTGALRALCDSEQVTPYMLLLAEFATLLYRRSGQDDILVGGPMANRELPGLEHLIGYFANTIVVRARLAGNPQFHDLLAAVRESVLASYEHQEVPLELVVDAVRPERDPGINPLVQVNFRVRVGAGPVLALGDTVVSPVAVDLGLARFDLALELHVLDDRLEAEFNYNTALFERLTIERLAGDFECLLRQSLTAPGTRLLSFALAEWVERLEPFGLADGDGGEGGDDVRPVAGIRGFRAAGGRPGT